MAGKTRVAKYHADRTNQKLYFCRLACQAADSSSDKQLYQAHCETAIFHLYGSFLAFMQELAQFYSLEMNEPTLLAIEQSLSERTQVSPEVMRLQQLLEHGFLANIERAYQRCLYAVLPDQLGLTIVAMIVDAIIFSSETGLFYIIVAFGLFLPGLAVTVRRLHDTGRSGWWFLISFVPLIGGIILLVFMASDTKHEANQWGPPAK